MTRCGVAVVMFFAVIPMGDRTLLAVSKALVSVTNLTYLNLNGIVHCASRSDSPCTHM